MALFATVSVGVSACTSSTEGSLTTPAAEASYSNVIPAGSFFDSATVHDLEIEVDEAEVETAVSTYLTEDDKTWVTATVTIDGQVFTDVGMRLKGNSSLRSISVADAQNAEELPWLVRLDKYIDGQSLDGVTSFAVRSSQTETALNEAVALELIGMAGLVNEEPTPVRMSVNGGQESLRLAIEHPDEEWATSEFSPLGVLYKAKAQGDYSYRGDDPDSYEDIFEVEAGDEDFAPLTSFLQFINESDDDTFAAELSDHLDVEAFASYLAIQELVGNFDDIDGPGNNSYLHYNPESKVMTVVPWDQNSSFGVQPGGAGIADGEPRMRPDATNDVGPEGAPVERVAGAEGLLDDGRPARPGPPMAGAGGNGEGGDGPGSNVLSERFLADETFHALYAERLAELTGTLYSSGAAAEVLANWTAVLTEQAGDLVSPEVLESEASTISGFFTP